MGTKKLIVNADDFGQSEGINRGIIQAHEKGIVTSASLMVRYPAAIAAAEYAKQNHLLGVGLHVDLGEWINRNGNWEALYEVVPMDDVAAVKDEVDKQLKAFYQLMGRNPTHIDSHQHVHQRKSIRSLFIELANRLNITVRGLNPNIRYCGDFYGQSTEGSPYHKSISRKGLQQIIESIPAGITEMACHPGLGDDIETMYRAERELEVQTLCDKAIKRKIKEQDIELCSFEGIPFYN